MRSRRSISPTDCCDETRRLNIARRFGSAMISNTDSTLLIYSTEHMRVKVYTGNPSRRPVIRQTGRGNLPFSRNHHKSLIQMGLFGCLVEAAGVEPVRAQLSSIPYAPGPLPARRVDIAMKGTSFVPN